MVCTVFLAATLRKAVSGYDPATGVAASVEPGETVLDVAGRLGIRAEDVKIIMVNGIHADWDTVLRGGERIGLFPPVGGG